MLKWTKGQMGVFILHSIYILLKEKKKCKQWQKELWCLCIYSGERDRQRKKREDINEWESVQSILGDFFF